MRILSLALVLCLAVIGCTTRMPHWSLTGEDKLSSTILTIDPTRDTTVVTPGGARLTIPAGALEGNGPIHLVVREAYTLADMVQGGLVTQSNERPLASGGMIYINTADGAAVKFRKRIRVAIPTNSLMEGMQVFKGSKDDNGVIDWVDPKPLLPNPMDSAIAKGKAMFLSNCAACHGLKGAVTGPALGWINEREPDKKWLHDYIRNNMRVLSSGDPYACYLYNQYNKSAMNLFPDLSDMDIDNILSYISNASQVIDSNKIPNYRRAFDSCGCRVVKRDWSAQYQAIYDTGTAGSRASGGQGSGAVAGGASAPGLAPAEDTVPLKKTIFYEFETDSFGWFNCDRFYEGMPGVEQSLVKLTIQGAYNNPTDVFLVIPSLKVLARGDRLDNGEYSFLHSQGGPIPLPQGQTAMILAMGEDNGRVVYWGKTQWVIGKSQELTVEPKVMDSAAIKMAIRNLHIENLSEEERDSIVSRQLPVTTQAPAGGGALGIQPCQCDCKSSFK